MSELNPEKEVLVAHITATAAAFQVLVYCLQNNGVLQRGEFPDALRQYMEIAKDRQSDIVLALLHDLREALVN